MSSKSSENNSGTSGFVSVPTEKSVQSVFYGIRKGARIPDGYFSDMNNMTSSQYPCLATRNTRMNMKALNPVSLPGEPVAVAEYDEGILFALSNGTICYRNMSYKLLSKITAMAALGKQLFCIPGGALFKNEIDTCEYAAICEAHSFDVKFCDSQFTDIDVNTDDTKLSQPSNGQYWYDKENKGLYKYSEASSQWVAVPAIYIKLKSSDFDFSRFHEGDALRITTDTEQVDSFVDAVFTDNMVIEGVFNSGITAENMSLNIERRFPEMQHICSHNNRIWGCYYDGVLNEIYSSKLGDPLNWYCYRGISTDSYAVSCGESGDFTGCSELGDSVVFFKENCIYTVYGSQPSDFQTVKTDCFGVQKGSEKSIVRINGQLYYKSCHGIMRLSEGSLPVCISDELGTDIWQNAIAGTDGRKYYIVMEDIEDNRVMYVYDTLLSIWHKEDIPVNNLFCFTGYKNNLLCVGKTETDVPAQPIRAGLNSGEAPRPEDYEDHFSYVTALVVYSAHLSMAAVISRLTDEQIKNLIAEETGKAASEVTDDEINDYLRSYVILEECYEHIIECAYVDSEARCNAFLPVNGDDIMQEEEGRFHFYAETGLRGLENTDYKRLKAVEIRMKLYPGSRLTLAVQYDDTGEWEDIDSFDDDNTGTFRFLHRLRKCDTYRLKFYGYGKVTIYSVAETYEEAGSNGI